MGPFGVESGKKPSRLLGFQSAGFCGMAFDKLIMPEEKRWDSINAHVKYELKTAYAPLIALAGLIKNMGPAQMDGAVLVFLPMAQCLKPRDVLLANR
ncbi:MAG: hypothetical protein CM15mP87_02970 [Candidatus Neomarinimicrobiota bacterium]|nr:MAG: hypothetical protein CM15mP87_02970 [Candidatus Neomarinimicrobiota bacterium]